jgi:hypothetical protein
MKKVFAFFLIGFLLLSFQKPYDFTQGNNCFRNMTPLNTKEIRFLHEISYQEIIQLDTFTSLGNEIVFFKPTKEEFDSLIKKMGETSGLYEVDDDFTYYANEVAKELKGTEIKVSFPTERIIKIVAFDNTISYLDRLENGTNEYGIIINSYTVEPRIEFGDLTDTDIITILGGKINGR